MKSKDIKLKLSSGQPTIGTWLQIPCSSTAEILSKLGYDWIAIDCEHGSFSPALMVEMIRAIELGGAVPFVRVSQAGSHEIKEALEAGARGIIIPMVEAAEQLEKSIEWAMFPPRGKRGIGYSRASLFGRFFKEYFESFNDDLIIVAQIEHITAVNQLNRILKVPNLNAIMVGPYDLSGSMGLTGKFDSPEFVAVMKKIHDIAAQCGIPMGTHIVTLDPAQVQERVNDGYQFIAYGTDGLFLYTAGVRPEVRAK